MGLFVVVAVFMSMFSLSFIIDTKNGNYVSAFFEAVIVLWGFVSLMFTVIPLTIGG